MATSCSSITSVRSRLTLLITSWHRFRNSVEIMAAQERLRIGSTLRGRFYERPSGGHVSDIPTGDLTERAARFWLPGGVLG